MPSVLGGLAIRLNGLVRAFARLTEKHSTRTITRGLVEYAMPGTIQKFAK